MADTKISALTALDQSTADPAKTYVPLFHQDGSPLNRRMNFTNLRVGSFLYAGASGSAARFSSAGNGVAVLTNDAGNDLSRVCFGGTTSLFPALKRSGAALHLRLADDSAFADLQLGRLRALTSYSNASGNHHIGDSTGGISFSGGGSYFNIGSHQVVAISEDGITARGSALIGFTSGAADAAGADVSLYRDAADRLAQRRSTNAQRFAVYRTWSAADNFERGVMSWYDSSTNDGVAGTVLRIGTEKGTVGGTARAVSIVTDGVERIGVASTGVSTFSADQVRVTTAKTPFSASDTGVTGSICWDSSFVYVCTATNTWKRAAIATW